VDVLIAPTMPYPAFKLGEKIDDPISLYLADVDTVPINLAGVPSISLPCGFSGGLPIGMQVIGSILMKPLFCAQLLHLKRIPIFTQGSRRDRNVRKS